MTDGQRFHRSSSACVVLPVFDSSVVHTAGLNSDRTVFKLKPGEKVASEDGYRSRSYAPRLRQERQLTESSADTNRLDIYWSRD